MSVNILVSVVNSLELPVSNATVSIYSDPTGSAIATAITDATGHTGLVLSPGKYRVRINNGYGVIYDVGNYVVAAIKPLHFSGIEMITGNPAASNGPFKPHRFRNTRYDNSFIGKTVGLAQKANWSIP